MSNIIATLPISVQAHQEMSRSRLLDNPYLLAVADGSMTKAAFVQSQQQFRHAVAHFTHPMLLLLSRIPDPTARLALLHNVVEEHGEFDPAHFHQATFDLFLHRLGHRSGIDPAGPAVSAFNAALSGVSAHQPIEVAVCCLGVIEFAFAEISERIGHSVLSRGWVEPEELVHYALHAEIDQRHAAELFDILGQPDLLPYDLVNQGLQLGLYLLDRLYRDLLADGEEPEPG